jgi:hypothetical protein
MTNNTRRGGLFGALGGTATTGLGAASSTAHVDDSGANQANNDVKTINQRSTEAERERR